MLSYQYLTDLKTRIHRRIWRILFRSNFRRFGKSVIIRPLRIQNAKYIEIGDQVNILDYAWLVAMKIDANIPKLIIEDCTRIGHFSHIASVRDVHIGKNVLMADRVYISDNLHSYEDITLPIKDQPIVFKGAVHIGDDSWIGENVSIIGATIGKHCVIGANSVVNRDIPDYSVAVGSPARIIKEYNFETGEWRKL